jgi:4-hydroxy-3-methylbut-2-enyl diphosphate reductase
VKVLAERCDLILVVGSETSSNSKRLVEVSHDRGVPSYLIDDASEIDDAWLDGVGTVGLTSGASAPEELVEGVIDWFRARGTDTVDTVMVVDEDVEFAMPSVLARRLRELGQEVGAVEDDADEDAGAADAAALRREAPLPR